MNLELLNKPFKPSDIEWQVQTVGIYKDKKGNSQPYVMALSMLLVMYVVLLLRLPRSSKSRTSNRRSFE